MQQINPYLSKKPLAVGIELIAKGFLSSFERIPQNCISEFADERKRQTIRSMLKINAAIMSGVVSCILPEDFLTMASGNPA